MLIWLHQQLLMVLSNAYVICQCEDVGGGIHTWARKQGAGELWPIHLWLAFLVVLRNKSYCCCRYIICYVSGLFLSHSCQERKKRRKVYRSYQLWSRNKGPNNWIRLRNNVQYLKFAFKWKIAKFAMNSIFFQPFFSFSKLFLRY